MIAPDDERLDRILESLQQVNVNLETLRVSFANLRQVVEDHESRLRVLERWKHHLTPILAALTFTLGAVAMVIVQKWITFAS